MSIAIDLQPIGVSRSHIGMAHIIIMPIVHTAAVVDAALAEVMFVVHVQRGVTPVPRVVIVAGNVMSLTVTGRIVVPEIEVVISG